MATSSHEKTKSGGAGDRSFAEQVDDLLECAICTEVMKSPKTLPCTHSFCLKCLEQYINKKDSKQRRSMCPICRSPFQASKIMSLPDNLLAKQFLEFREKLKKSSSAEEESRQRKISEPWCENCCDESEESQQSPEAIKYCEQCDQNLCLRCVEAHRVLKITSTHSLVDLIIPKKTSTSHTSCPNHPSHQATTYCEDCNILACEECVETDHCFHATAVMECLAAELNNEAMQAGDRAKHLEQMIQLTEEDKAQLLNRITEIEGKIHREAERLHVLVNEGEAKLLEDLGLHKKKMMKKFAAYVEGAEFATLVLHGRIDKFNRLANMASCPTSIGRAIVEAKQQRQETQNVFAIRQARPRHDLNVVFANNKTRSNYIGEILSNLGDEDKTEEPKGFDEDDDGCVHYKRRCGLKASCCTQVYTCHHCHDASEDHKIDRTRVSTVVCHLCSTEQPVARWCRSCDVDFGRYYCAVCRIYDDDDKGQFHCDKCSICRLGGRHNYWHCDRCGICISTIIRETHQCIAGAALDDCQICGKAMFDSTECLRILPCGHFIHPQCHIDHPGLKGNCLSCAESGRNSK